MRTGGVPVLPPEAHRLLVRSIRSVELLEIALLLSRSPDTFWTPSAIAQQLGMALEVVAKAVDALVTSELIVAARETVAYRFAPKRDEDCEAMAALAEAYATQRANVIKTIYSASLEQLRAFADSFRLKKE